MRRDSKYRMGCWSVLAAVAAILTLPTNSKASLISLIIAGACSLLFAEVALRLARNRRKTLAERSSTEATTLANRLGSGEQIEPFMLYLRPFYADRIVIKNPARLLRWVIPLHLADDTINWEFRTIRRIEKSIRVIALGDPRASPGADRISVSDHAWRARFVLLALFADAIAIYPSVRGSSLWELEWLKQNSLLDKCIFIIPDHFEHLAGRDGETLEALHLLFKTLNIEYPGSIFGGGCIFVVNSDGSIRQRYGGAEIGSWYVAHAVIRLMRLVKTSNRPVFSDVWTQYLSGRDGTSGQVHLKATQTVPVEAGEIARSEADYRWDWVEQQLE